MGEFWLGVVHREDRTPLTQSGEFVMTVHNPGRREEDLYS